MASRIIHHADALTWLRAEAPLEKSSIITSLPDVSELSGFSVEMWRRWFVDAAVLVAQSVADDAVAVFYQSDIVHDGVWIDKGALISEAAARAGAKMLFHKIVCRKPLGTITFGRASYSHLMAFSRGLRVQVRGSSADVIADAGFMPGAKSMGVNACTYACKFVLKVTTSRTIVDPFCGFGTVLAVANDLGLDAVGVDLSKRMCRKARALNLSSETGASVAGF